MRFNKSTTIILSTICFVLGMLIGKYFSNIMIDNNIESIYIEGLRSAQTKSYQAIMINIIDGEKNGNLKGELLNHICPASVDMMKYFINNEIVLKNEEEIYGTLAFVRKECDKRKSQWGN